MPRITEIGALRIVNPHAWAVKVAKAMKAASGHVSDAAAALGCSPRQLHRWLATDKLLAKVERAPDGVCKDYSNAGRRPREVDDE